MIANEQNTKLDLLEKSTSFSEPAVQISQDQKTNDCTTDMKIVEKMPEDTTADLESSETRGT